jgi:hypothetical protein
LPGERVFGQPQHTEEFRKIILRRLGSPLPSHPRGEEFNQCLLLRNGSFSAAASISVSVLMRTG